MSNFIDLVCAGPLGTQAFQVVTGTEGAGDLYEAEIDRGQGREYLSVFANPEGDYDVHLLAYANESRRRREIDEEKVDAGRAYLLLLDFLGLNTRAYADQLLDAISCKSNAGAVASARAFIATAGDGKAAAVFQSIDMVGVDGISLSYASLRKPVRRIDVTFGPDGLAALSISRRQRERVSALEAVVLVEEEFVRWPAL